MRLCLAVVIVVVLLLLIPLKIAHCQNYLQYKIQVNGDVSASWTVTQVSDINASVDTWNGFEQRVCILLDAAKNATLREMAVDPDSLQLETTIPAKTNPKRPKTCFLAELQYNRKWQHCVRRRVSHARILRSTLRRRRTPDYLPFKLHHRVSCPETKPTRRHKQTLTSFRIQDFTNGKPNITLTSNSPNGYSIGFQQSAIEPYSWRRQLLVPWQASL